MRKLPLIVLVAAALGACGKKPVMTRPTPFNQARADSVAAAPAPTGELVDRVVAVVGDSVVLSLDLEEAILGLAAQGQQLPPPSDAGAQLALRKSVLDSKVSELLLVQAAERDTITVDEAQIAQAVEQDVAQRQKQFGTQAAFEAALRRENLTIQSYREMRSREFKRTSMIQQYLARVERTRRMPSVTEDEIKAYFEQQKAQLGRRPATVSFTQAVVVPHASDTARTSARTQAEELLAKVRAGEDFAVLAKRYSMDPGSKEKGGDLGWFRREQMMTDFSNAAYAMRPGEISNIVETPFGFHIIKLEKIRGGERQARHILIQPTMVAEDVARAKATADSLVARLRAGASIDSIARLFKDPNEESKIGPYPKDRLPDPYKEALESAKVGDIIGPLPLAGDLPNQEKYAVVKVQEVLDAGEYSLDDPLVRGQIREQLQKQKMVAEVVEDLRKRSFVEVRL